MSDQSFGKASRDAWDDMERLDEHRRQFERDEVRERIALHTWQSIYFDKDWYAMNEDTFDDPDRPVGSGKTEQEAIDDLIDKIMERST